VSDLPAGGFRNREVAGADAYTADARACGLGADAADRLVWTERDGSIPNLRLAGHPVLGHRIILSQGSCSASCPLSLAAASGRGHSGIWLRYTTSQNNGATLAPCSRMVRWWTQRPLLSRGLRRFQAEADEASAKRTLSPSCRVSRRVLSRFFFKRSSSPFRSPNTHSSAIASTPKRKSAAPSQCTQRPVGE
jgi:hypothetical protein